MLSLANNAGKRTRATGATQLGKGNPCQGPFITIVRRLWPGVI